MKRATGKIQPVQKVWLSTQEAAAYLGCSLDLLETLRNKAEVSFAKYGRTIWYDLTSINRFMNRNKVI